MPEPRRRAPWGCLVVLVAIAIAALFGWREYQRILREDPQSLPWTDLSLDQPVGRFTSQKLARLTAEPERCRALLAAAGSTDRPVPPVRPDTAQCGYDDGMALARGGTRPLYAPAGLVTACPVAAALHLWEGAVQREAEARLGSRVARIEHYGSYSCRRRNGATTGEWSEHATADAVDIAGFVLADGRRLTIVGDWSKGDAEEQGFLRAVRDRACDLFTVTLSPDYNEAHRDHLHLDMSAWGGSSFGMCR